MDIIIVASQIASHTKPSRAEWKGLIRAAPSTLVTREEKSNFSIRVLRVEDATVEELQAQS